MAQVPALHFPGIQEHVAMRTCFSRLSRTAVVPNQITGIWSPRNARAANRPLIGSGMGSSSLMISPSAKVHPVSTDEKSQTSEPAQDDEEHGHQAFCRQAKEGAGVSVLSSPEVIEKLQRSMKRSHGRKSYRAMYSSIFGGITLDHTLMVIPIDDHMVHLGHGVFDTAAIIDSYLYDLDAHLDRLLRSSSMAKITPPFDRSYIRDVLVKTATASQCKRGLLRFWLSAGPGDFVLSSSVCPISALYAVVIEYSPSSQMQGVKVVTSSIPMKPPQFQVLKSVNYLPNVLSQLEAEEKGAFAAIWFCDEGFVAEGPRMNVAFINREKELLMPSFEKILSGCTARRLLALAPRLVEQGHLKGIRVENIPAEEARAAEEMMLVGTALPILPVVMWDDQPIGNGKEGPLTLALSNLLLEDMKDGPDWIRIPVPYGDESTYSDSLLQV